MDPLRVSLASIGTDGDILPYAALGAALVRRGHRATLLASGEYEEVALRHGLAFRPLVSRDENARCFTNPDFWHPIKGPAIGARWGTAFLPRQYELMRELAREPRSVFVASPAIVTARIVQEKFGRPLATVVLQPWMIPSSTAPPVMPLGLTLPRWAPRPVGSLYWLGFDAVGAMLLGGPLNALRREVGLPPVRRVFRWWLSPQCALGLFPDWYGAPQPDWPPQVRLTGFPLSGGREADGPAGPALDAGLSAFLDAGTPPVAFTFGTGMRHSADLFREAAEACRALGVRGVFLTKFADQVPAPLPSSVWHATFAPFRHLFPRCAAVVHHGGIGTLAEALAAGAPQLVLPIAYDQTDNAMRVQRLGAGAWLPARRAVGPRIATALAGLLTPDARKRSRAVAGRFTPGDDALAVAAQHVEALGGYTAPTNPAGGTA